MRWSRKGKKLNPKNVPVELHPFIDLVDKYGPLDYGAEDCDRIMTKLENNRAKLDEIERRLADWRGTEMKVFNEWADSCVNKDECDRFHKFFMLLDGFDIRPEEPKKDPIEKAMHDLRRQSPNPQVLSGARFIAALALRRYGAFAKPAIPLLHDALQDEAIRTRAEIRAALAEIARELGDEKEYENQLDALRDLRREVATALVESPQQQALLEAELGCIDEDLELLTGNPHEFLGMCLCTAITDDHLPRIKQLLERVSVETLDHDGRPPIVNAALGDSINAMRYLLEKGADPNRRWRDMTALHIAVEERHNEKTIKLLIENGADVTLTNDEGETAADIAKEYGHPEYVPLLKANEM